MNYEIMRFPVNKQPGLADEQLLQYFINGDPGAMSTLVELYKDRIYTSIYGMVQDKQQAEEIFRAVFIKAIDNMIAGKAVEEGKFLSWAMQLAHGLCIEYRRSSALLNTSNENRGQQKNNLMPVITNGHSFESHGKIRNLIEMLPAPQREVILLNHYGGLSFKEIAELTKCSLNSALETMRYALRSLQKLMLEKQAHC